MKLARTRKYELFGLRVAVKMERRIFFKYLVQGGRYLVFVRA